MKKSKQKTTEERRRDAAAAEELKAIRYQSELLKLERAKMLLAAEERKLAAIKKAEAEAKAAKAEGYEPTLEALARRFEISRQTLAGLMRQPGAPRKHCNKGYLVKEWTQWLLTPAPISEEKKQLLRLKTALWNARTEELKRRNDEHARKFMPREEAEGELLEYGRIVREAAAKLPQMVMERHPESEALLAAAKETVAELNHIVDHFTRGFSHYVQDAT